MVRPIASFDWIAQTTGPMDASQFPQTNPVDTSFACPKCALSGVDGNTLARHLVEECVIEGATLQPDPTIVAARRQAEEQARLHQEQQQRQDQVLIAEVI